MLIRVIHGYRIEEPRSDSIRSNERVCVIHFRTCREEGIAFDAHQLIEEGTGFRVGRHFLMLVLLLLLLLLILGMESNTVE